MFAARGLSYPIDRASIKEPSPVSEDEEEGEWDKAEGIYEAISEITPGDCEVVKDGHLPDDGFTSRAAKAVEASGHWCSSPDVQAMEEEVREYLLTGKSFVGGGDPDEGGREMWQILTEDANAELDAERIWAKRPEKDAWTLSSEYQAMGSEVRHNLPHFLIVADFSLQGLDRCTYGAVVAVVDFPGLGEGARAEKTS